MEQKFKLFKKMAPAAFFIGTVNLAYASNPNDAIFHTKSCENDSRTFRMYYDDLIFRPQNSKDSYVFFRHLDIGGQSYFGGTWDLMGRGEVTDAIIKLEITSAFTGDSESTLVGWLEGRKLNGEWKFSFKSPDSKIFEPLGHCQKEY